MSIKDKSTEYMYISARVRAIEANMPGREMIGRMIDAKDAESAAVIAVEGGVLTSAEAARDPDTLDSALMKRLRDALSVAETDGGGKNITPIIRIAYDCANIKAALRCVPNSIDFSDLLFDVGSLPVQRYGEMALSGDFSDLPKNLAEAAEAAKREYSATADPLKIDLPIDRACYADMLDSAQRLGDAFAVDLVKAKIDMTNIMITLRVLRAGENDMMRAMLADALIDGGYIDAADLREAAGDTSNAKEKITALTGKKYPAVAEALTTGEKDFENACDSYIEAKIHEARYIPFGASVVLAFLCELEYEIKNIRIILAGLAAGLSGESIAERVRGSYV